MAPRLPLSALLSQALVAFTIELDNHFESAMPHRTSWGPAARSGDGPWLVSWVMWANFLQYVGEDGRSLGELDGPARMTNLAGLKRWGYITVEPDPTDAGSQPPKRDWRVRLTRAGHRARKVWQPLPSLIDTRWRERFGDETVAGLREALQVVVSQCETALPDYLPVVHHAMHARVPRLDPWLSACLESRATVDLDLVVLLSRTLLSLTLDVEQHSTLSLAVSSNVLRVLDSAGIRVRDLPRLTGVSKEAVSVCVGYLERNGYIAVETDPRGGRSKLAKLTAAGHAAQGSTGEAFNLVDEQWARTYGERCLHQLRCSLEALVGDRADGPSRLLGGLPPDGTGWRASLRTPDTLPHHPMVLHRGGFPDGS